MTSQSKYRATNDDLPEFFFRRTAVSKKLAAPSSREIEVALHYPAIEWRDAKQIKREQRAERRASRPDDSTRKIYIKGEKQRQMNAWLEALDAQKPRLTSWETGFVADLFRKFRRYFPGVKWVTRNQYEALKHIAVKNLKLPGAI